ncbi:MAG: hypothetical protein JWP97_1323 [Labilithrix sp.]|nr:hypothetical protein [Labilithrix sp.]
MFETAGTLTIVEIVSSLVALVVLPMLWSGFAAFAELRGAGDARPRSAVLAVRVAIAGSALTVVLAAFHAVRASLAPPGQVAQQHVSTLARFGSLDIGLDLVRDPTSSACALLAAVIGFAAVLHAAWTAPARIAGRLAWTGLATAAVILVAIADGLPCLAIGLQLATLAGWALAGGGRTRVLVLALAGDVALVFAGWVLFWSLGGSFSTSGFTPDPLPRFAIVAVPEAPRADGKASVALTTYTDALVSSDDGPPLPNEPVRAPFLAVLEPGVYSFRIQASAATADMLVTHVTLAPGRSYVLTPYGPTTSFSNLDDQLQVPRPTPSGATSMRTVLASRVFGGVRVASVVGLLAVLAALLRLALLAKTQQGGLAYALEAIPPVVIAIHMLPLVDPGAALGLAILPAFMGLLLAGDAAAAGSSDRVPRAVVASLAALAVAAVLVGEPAGAMVILVAAGLGGAASTTALDAEADVRWLGMASASLAGVLPGAGSSAGIASALQGSLVAASLGHPAGAAVALLLAGSALLVALAAFRVYGASIRQPLPTRGKVGPRTMALALAALSLMGGAVLGVGSSQLGGRTVPLARRLVDPPGGVDAYPKVMILALLITVAMAVLGLLAARRASTTREPPAWLASLAFPVTVVGRVARRASALVWFFVRSVTVMNEDVIDDAADAASSALARLGRLVGRRGPSAGAAAATAGDDPRAFGRLELVLVTFMVTVLGVVVLSSVVLG